MSRNAGRIAAEAGLSNLAIAIGVSSFEGHAGFDCEIPRRLKARPCLQGLRYGRDLEMTKVAECVHHAVVRQAG